MNKENAKKIRNLSLFYSFLIKTLLIISAITIVLKFLLPVLIGLMESLNKFLGSELPSIGKAFVTMENLNSNMDLTFIFKNYYLIIFIILIVLYAISIVLRHHFGEIQPISDDQSSKLLKGQILTNLDVPSSFDTTANKNISDFDKEVNRYLRKRKVVIQTFLDVSTKRVYRECLIYFDEPESLKLRNAILNKINGLETVLASSFRGEMTFGAVEIDVKHNRFVFQGSSDVTEKFENKFNKKEKVKRVSKKEKTNNVNNGEIQINKDMKYTFPLSLFEDNTGKIEEFTQKAEAFANEKKEEIEVFLQSSNIQVQLRAVNVGNNTIEYVFKMPKFSKDFNAFNYIQENLSHSISIAKIKVTTRAGSLNIIIPSPKDCCIPIDVPTLFVRAFEESEGIR